MHCPRCGTQFEEGDRYCASCGADLRQASAPPRERRSLRERAEALIGTTRRARLITAGTVVAILIAIVAFIALDPAEDDEIPRDAYTVAADEICVVAKKQIAAARLRAAGDDDPGAYADRLVPIVSGWRSEFNALDPPQDRIDEAEALDAALRDVQIESGALARVAREESRKELLETSARVDDLTIAVEEDVASLNLDRCADVVLGAAEPQ